MLKDLRALANAVALALFKKGHRPVLVGGACAAIYAAGKVIPTTIEFVIIDYAPDSVARAMAGIGFRPNGVRAYRKGNSPFEVQLSPAPVIVGDDIVEKFESIKEASGKIMALSPTDCVRHRLSWYYRWGDLPALEEALAVCRRRKVDMDLIRRWSQWEWASDRFEEFAAKIER